VPSMGTQPIRGLADSKRAWFIFIVGLVFLRVGPGRSGLGFLRCLCCRAPAASFPSRDRRPVRRFCLPLSWAIVNLAVQGRLTSIQLARGARSRTCLGTSCLSAPRTASAVRSGTCRAEARAGTEGNKNPCSGMAGGNKTRARHGVRTETYCTLNLRDGHCHPPRKPALWCSGPSARLSRRRRCRRCRVD